MPLAMPHNDEPISAPTPKPRATICPYCGGRSRSLSRCDACRGLFDPLSRQATQNAMGPWFVRDESRPHMPGCSYETLVRLIGRGQVARESVLRGPPTLQFWTLARWCPGVAHLLGVCHSCGEGAEPTDTACSRCGASFRIYPDRQNLGLGERRFVPGQPGISPEEGQLPTPAAVQRAEVPPGETVPTLVGEAELDARMGRLRRELTRSRRWAAVWCVGFALVAVTLTAAIVLPTLDIEAGPLGHWLRPDVRESSHQPGSDLGGTPVEVRPAPRDGRGVDTVPGAAEEARPDRGENLENSPPDADDNPFPNHDGDARGLKEDPDVFAGVGEALEEFERLRRLR